MFGSSAFKGGSKGLEGGEALALKAIGHEPPGPCLTSPLELQLASLVYAYDSINHCRDIIRGGQGEQLKHAPFMKDIIIRVVAIMDDSAYLCEQYSLSIHNDIFLLGSGQHVAVALQSAPASSFI